MNQLICENMSMCYGKNPALENVSFSVRAGDYICVVGENGSGKSTLLKGVLGLHPLSEGHSDFAPGIAKTDIGYLPQQTQIQRDFPASVSEVVLSGCQNRSGFRFFYSAADRKKAGKNINRLGLDDIKTKSYRDLSGGQQQRVLLARALCSAHRMLFLDEPVTGLDPSMTAGMYDLLFELNAREGLSIVMTSHDVETAGRYADKILHLEKKLLFFGSVGDYKNSEFSKKFIGGHCGGRG